MSRIRIAGGKGEGCKTCIACGEEKPATEEHFYRSRGTGFQGRCKPCEKLRDKAYRTGNRMGTMTNPRGGHEHVSATICPVCCCLPWRVEGIACRYCQQPRQSEPPVELDVSRRFAQPWY